MIARLTEALLNLTGRERLAVVALLVVALPLGAVFAVLLPLATAAQDARRMADDARALRDWVSMRAAETAAMAAATPHIVAGPLAPVGLAQIDQSLRAAGLRDAIDRLGDRGAGEVELGFADVRFTALATWLESMAPGWGYAITSLRIDRTEDPDLVNASLILRPQP